MLYITGNLLLKRIICLAILLMSLLVKPAIPQQIVRLSHAHSHNDYNQERPLYSALDQGFISIEADVFLANHDLYVAHNRVHITPSGTLRSLYLDPLFNIVHDTTGKYFHLFPVFLLIDIKSAALPTYLLLEEQLKPYQEMITRFSGDSVINKAVTVIISGNRAIGYINNQQNRLVAIDGRLEDITKPANLFPMISTSFQSLGNHRLPVDSIRKRLLDLSNKVHQQNKKLRIWGVPDTEIWWQIQLDDHLDLIGTDHPEDLKNFLLHHY